MLDDLIHRVCNHSPRPLLPAAQQPEAAVLIPITRTATPEVVLTLRASGLSTHGGEVAFPGGRRDRLDRDLIGTALRESTEEIGLPAGLVEVIGPLSSVVSLHGIHVTPYVGLVPETVAYQPNVAEIAAIFSVPLEFFCRTPQETILRVDHLGMCWRIPCYRYAGYKIWGLTALMIVELVNLLYDAGIPLQEGGNTAANMHSMRLRP